MKSGQLNSKSHDIKSSQDNVECSLKLNIYSCPTERKEIFQFYSLITPEVLEELGADSFCEELQSVTAKNEVHGETFDESRISILNVTPKKNTPNVFNQINDDHTLVNSTLVLSPENNILSTSLKSEPVQQAIVNFIPKSADVIGFLRENAKFNDGIVNLESTPPLIFNCSPKLTEFPTNETNNLVIKRDPSNERIVSNTEEIVKPISSIFDFNSENLVADENQDLSKESDQSKKETCSKSEKIVKSASPSIFDLNFENLINDANKDLVIQSDKFLISPVNKTQLTPSKSTKHEQNLVNEVDELFNLHPIKSSEVYVDLTSVKSDKSFNAETSQDMSDDAICGSSLQSPVQNIAVNVFSTPQKSGQPLIFGFSPEEPVNPPTFSNSTPDRIALSLGATLGDHKSSWTKSMETPSLKPSRLIEDCLDDTLLLKSPKNLSQSSSELDQSVDENLKMEDTRNFNFTLEDCTQQRIVKVYDDTNEIVKSYLGNSSLLGDLDTSDRSYVAEKDICGKPLSNDLDISKFKDIEDCCSAISSEDNEGRLKHKKIIHLNEKDCNSECANHSCDAYERDAKIVLDVASCDGQKRTEQPTSEIKEVDPAKLSEVHCKMCCSKSASLVEVSSSLQHKTAYVVYLNDVPPGMYQVVCNGDLQLTPAENVKFNQDGFYIGQLHQEIPTAENEINMQKNVKEDSEDVKLVDNAKFKSTNEFNPISTKYAGFSTASGKQVNVSESALSNARRLFQDTLAVPICNLEINNCDGGNLITEANLKTVKEVAAGGDTIDQLQVESRWFSAASSKRIEISCSTVTNAILDEVDRENLLPLNKISSDITKSLDHETLIKKTCDSNISVNTEKSNTNKLEPLTFPSKFQVFSTGCGKSITVNEESFSKAKQLLTIGNNIDIGTRSSTSKINNFGEFSTASRKDVVISEVGLLKAKEILQVDETNARVSPTKSINFGGFATASGKAVVISEEALLKAKEKLQVDETNAEVFPTKSINFGRFATTSGKAVVISEEALLKAKEKLQVDETNAEVFPTKSINFGGFATASGKAVVISEEALLKAKEKLQVDETNAEVFPTKSINFGGFATASGKAVVISEEALLKAKEKLQVDETNAKVSCTKSINFGGFATASGKSVVISEEALLEAKEKLQIDEMTARASTSKCFDRFATASGKVVAVSEEALLKVKEKFQDDETTASSLYDLQIDNRSGKKHCYSSMSETPERKTSIERKRLKISREFSPTSSKKEISKEDWDEIAADFLHDDTENSETFAFDKSKELSTEIQMSMAALLADETESKDENNWMNSSQVTKTKRKNIELQSTPRRSKRLRGKGSQVTEHEKPVVLSSILKKRNEASKLRWERLVKKQKEVISSVMGVIWQKKHESKEKRMKLCDLTKVLPPSMHADKLLKSGIISSVLDITSANSEDYCFLWEEARTFAPSAADGILNLDCGAVMIFSEDNRLGKDEFYDGLIDLNGIDSNLISKRWVFNHYRWIIWKLSSLEKALPDNFGGKLLSPNSVMNQLQYRYNVEIDKCKRSIIKKLYEQDDTPTKTMILCVSNIFHESSKSAINGGINSIELTDGWYKIKAVIDERLAILILSGKIYIGLKVIIFGCEFVSTFEPCDPLESLENVCLQLNANSCRRARWDSKLGVHFSLNQSVPLRSLFADGGRVACLDILIARLYPMQYLEKKGDGSYLVFNDRTNDKANRLFEASRNSLLDDLKKNILAEFEDQEDKKKRRLSRRFLNRGNLSREDIETLTSGEEISEILETSSEPLLIENCLSEYQKSKLYEFKINEGDKKRYLMEKALESKAKVVNQRVVIPFLKFIAVGLSTVDLESDKCALITIWKPSHDLESLLKEGKTIRVFNLCAEKKRDEIVLNLKSTPQVKFLEISDKAHISERMFVPREIIPFNLMMGNFKAVYDVVDIVGVVIKSRLKEHGRFDCVYLADASMDIIIIKFWDGLKAFCLEDVLIPETFIYASNLQWRGKTNSHVQCVYASETTVFTQRPRNLKIRTVLDELEKSVMSDRQFFEKANEKIGNMTNNHPFIPAVRTSVFWKPASTSTPLSRGKKERNAFGDDLFTSHPNTSISPLVDVNKGIDHKVKTLERYGEPPPLLPLYRANLVGVRKGFKPPLKSNK